MHRLLEKAPMSNTEYGVQNGPAITEWAQITENDNFFDDTNSSDFNGDGIDDILWRRDTSAFLDPGQVAIWILNGASIVDGGFLDPSPRGTDAPSDWRINFSYGDWQSYIPFGQYGWIFTEGYPVSKLDFDGNGTSDILWAKGDSTELAIWNMQGASIINGAFLQGTPRSGETDWDLSSGADLNGDGKSDILWRKESSSVDANAGEVAVWIMDGPTIVDGGFLPTSPIPTDDPDDWFFELADFNGDGKTDLLWEKSDFASTSPGLNAIWIMDGPAIVDGGFLQTSPRTEDDPIDWVSNFADFNGDGKTDFVWRSEDTGENAIWIMDGPAIVDGGFLQNSPITTDDPDEWSHKLADFNGDNKTDYFWENDITGQKATWIMDGPDIINGGFLPTNPKSGTNATDWDSFFADFNGDGKTDILWNNTNDDEFAIWIMDGPNIVDGGFLQDAPNFGEDDWEFQFRELNGDGKTDFYWTSSSGTKAVWLMDGPDIVGGGFLPQDNPSEEFILI
jgi:hypothetical protein